MRNGAKARVIVRENGKGISAAFLPHVFERFRQAPDERRQGLDLGLAIVHHVVELHGGELSVEGPGEGKGATFTAEIRLALVSATYHPESTKLTKAWSRRATPPASSC